ncbi:hypothetical protein PAPYR_9909 [Paratrimastix pyriformis]|uniref:Tyrosine-protein kinase ephrin type A/B receptor-like domain-containing protein n=1 Tax=Paratrimastix pyriformis TaxID=342808 RepID=A0ABQ8UAX9_9EUKA|nr:hypothetical protein PAPYR_9909 [Paratrimastix pyriformis]
MRLFRPLALTLVIGFLLSSATAETCSEAECRKAYSACVEGKRTVQYFAPRDCTPPVPAQVSCDCTADDYYAVYTDCDSTTRTRTATYVKYTDCVNGVPLPPAKTVKCSCSLKDLEVTFGVCDSSNNTRKIVPYFAHDCEGGDALPAPHDVPCDFKCEAGRRLNLTSPTFDCVDCPAGTVSLGGGMVFNKWGPTWPVQFHTECRSTRDGSSTCNGWAMGGTFIDSGNNTGIDSINSDLTLTFDLVMAGSLSFTYRVDSEKGWDGLVVLVDGAAKLPLTSFQPVWTLVTYALPQGLHTVVFRYQKDATGSRFLDRAFLQKIIIRGTSYADKECTSCAPGSTSDARSDSCHLCPRDTRAAGYGNPSCTACDPDQYANSGSEQCVTRPACTITDFQWLYSECSASTATRTKYAVWLQPQICNSTCPDCGLPPSTTADCAPCNPGEAPNEHHLCEACPEGTWSPGGNVACAPCNAGSAVAKSLSMKYFGSLPANATTSCEGESCGSAWRAMNEYLDSGSGHTGPVQVHPLCLYHE